MGEPDDRSCMQAGCDKERSGGWRYCASHIRPQQPHAVNAHGLAPPLPGHSLPPLPVPSLSASSAPKWRPAGEGTQGYYDLGGKFSQIEGQMAMDVFSDDPDAPLIEP